MKIDDDVTQRNWEDFYRRFRGIRCLNLKSALRMDAVYSSEGGAKSLPDYIASHSTSH